MTEDERLMAKEKSAAVVHPVHGTPMYPRPALDKRELVNAMRESGHPIAYAANFADRVHEKEQAEGVLYVDPLTGYSMRVKNEA